MTNADGSSSFASAAIAALEAVAVLDGWLRELRAELALERALSRPSVRRVESSIADLEDILSEVQRALVLLAFEGVRDPEESRKAVVERCSEILASWRVSLEEAESRGARHERDFFARFLPQLSRILEVTVKHLSSRLQEAARDEKRDEEERRLLARAGLPVM